MVKEKLEDCLNKTYEVKTYTDNLNHTRCRLLLPMCFSGKRIKLVVVEESN